MVATACDNRVGLNRKRAATIICIAEFKALGLGFFDFFDFLAATGMALGVAVMPVYILARWKFYRSRARPMRALPARSVFTAG